MTRTLNTKDWTHIPESSSYNSNYYKNSRTGEIIYAEGDDDDTIYYYEAMVDEKGAYHRGSYIGYCSTNEFSIPNEFLRKRRLAAETSFEFDNNLS